MNNKHRFSKIHAYSPHKLTNSIHPYYIRAESKFSLDDMMRTAWNWELALSDLS